MSYASQGSEFNAMTVSAHRKFVVEAGKPAGHTHVECMALTLYVAKHA
jgi:hypothetical protein